MRIFYTLELLWYKENKETTFIDKKVYTSLQEIFNAFDTYKQEMDPAPHDFRVYLKRYEPTKKKA